MNKSIRRLIQSRYKRRDFLAAIGTGVGITAISPMSYSKPNVPDIIPSAGMTIQQVIDIILKEIPGAPFSQTVDTLKSGNASQVVTGIVTTMFATIDVIRKTASLGANFIIAHEPTFYMHTDEKEWLANDPVFKFKMDLLDKHKIAVWRFHDYWHTHNPDGVLMGVLAKMGWEKLYNPKNPRMIEHSSITVDEIVATAKKGLGIRQVRVIGDLKQSCKRIALIPGAAGGRTQIKTLQEETPDVLIVGEVHEWETAEYVRDARAMGQKTSLIVLGHAESEEPGMEWLVPWLTSRVKDFKITHVPSHNPFVEA